MKQRVIVISPIPRDRFVSFWTDDLSLPNRGDMNYVSRLTRELDLSHVESVCLYNVNGEDLHVETKAK